MKKTFFQKTCSIALLIMAMCCCNPHKEMAPAEMQDISITNIAEKRKVKMSEIAASVEVIPLETSDNALVGMISKVVSQGNKVYVSDGNALYKFSKQGKFLGKIDKKGIGAGEYKGISDFAITAADEAWILSRSSQQIILYDWSGNAKRTIKTDYWANNIFLFDNKTMFLYIGNETNGENTYQVRRLNLETGEADKGFLPIDEYKAKYLFIKSPDHFNMNRKSGYGYFFDAHNDTIYRLTKEAVEPMLHIDKDGKNIPSSFYRKNYQHVMEFFMELNKHNYAWNGSCFGESAQNYVCTYFYNKKLHMSIIHKSNLAEQKDFTIIKEDMNFSNFPFELTENPVFIQNGNELIIPLSPFQIVDYGMWKLDEKKQEELKKRVNYIGEDQNPLILIVTLK